jgi:hypothetical protein
VPVSDIAHPLITATAEDEARDIFDAQHAKKILYIRNGFGDLSC